MSLASQIEAYVAALLGLIALDDLFGGVDALLARDSASHWEDTEN